MSQDESFGDEQKVTRALAVGQSMSLSALDQGNATSVSPVLNIASKNDPVSSGAVKSAEEAQDKEKWLEVLRSEWETRSHEKFIFEEDNVAQLEALVEFYVNYNDPWIPRTELVPGANVPLDPDGKLGKYSPVSFANNRYNLVLIDSFGWRIRGNSAKILESAPSQPAGDVILSDISPSEFNKINAGFDTIYFPEAKDRKTFRIEETQDGNIISLALEDGEVVNDLGSRWEIPAGIGGSLPPFISAPQVVNDNLPVTMINEPMKYDHYDGVLLVLKDGIIKGKFRFTSYCSLAKGYLGIQAGKHVYEANREYSLSIRGNKEYSFFSFRAGSQYIEYGFKVGDRQTMPQNMRLYFADEAKVGTRDKFVNEVYNVFIHEGFMDRNTGSASCQVSPDFFEFRDTMIKAYMEDADENDDSKKLLGKKLGQDPNVDEKWNYKFRGAFWLIRPNERPID